MSDPILERRVRLKDTHTELDQFERQAAAVLAFTVTLCVVSYGILIHVLL